MIFPSFGSLSETTFKHRSGLSLYDDSGLIVLWIVFRPLNSPARRKPTSLSFLKAVPKATRHLADIRRRNGKNRMC
jgi:hypothetical protein